MHPTSRCSRIYFLSHSVKRSKNLQSWRNRKCRSSRADFRSSFRFSVSAIDQLATELAKLPGIGRKTALRLTYHLLKQPAEQSKRLADALVTLAERVRPCAMCFNLTEEELCAICRD